MAPYDSLKHLRILFRVIGIDVHHHAARVSLRYSDDRLISNLQNAAGPGLLFIGFPRDWLQIQIRAKLPPVDSTAGFFDKPAETRQAEQ
jgi:hypothetical protein